MISFEEFKKMDIRVAKVIEAEKIKDSKNLLKLKIDLGEEEREIITGIANFYSVEKLIGKEIVIIANLEPKVFFGVKSQGMLLAADDNGKPVLLVPDKEVPPGSKIS